MPHPFTVRAQLIQDGYVHGIATSSYTPQPPFVALETRVRVYVFDVGENGFELAFTGEFLDVTPVGDANRASVGTPEMTRIVAMFVWDGDKSSDPSRCHPVRFGLYPDESSTRLVLTSLDGLRDQGVSWIDKRPFRQRTAFPLPTA